MGFLFCFYLLICNLLVRFLGGVDREEEGGGEEEEKERKKEHKGHFSQQGWW